MRRSGHIKSPDSHKHHPWRNLAQLFQHSHPCCPAIGLNMDTLYVSSCLYVAQHDITVCGRQAEVARERLIPPPRYLRVTRPHTYSSHIQLHARSAQMRTRTCSGPWPRLLCTACVPLGVLSWSCHLARRFTVVRLWQQLRLNAIFIIIWIFQVTHATLNFRFVYESRVKALHTQRFIKYGHTTSPINSNLCTILLSPT